MKAIRIDASVFNKLITNCFIVYQLLWLSTRGENKMDMVPNPIKVIV